MGRQVKVEMNTEFLARTMTSREVVDLVEGWLRGGFSQDTLLWNLQRHERLPPGRTIEDEKQLIEIEMPPEARVTG